MISLASMSHYYRMDLDDHSPAVNYINLKRDNYLGFIHGKSMSNSTIANIKTILK